MQKVLHISFADDSKGEEYIFTLKILQIFKKSYGIDCHWITIKNKNLILKKKQLLREILKN